VNEDYDELCCFFDPVECASRCAGITLAKSRLSRGLARAIHSLSSSFEWT